MKKKSKGSSRIPTVEPSRGDEMAIGLQNRGDGMQPIVGLGASAGGIAALREFFTAMPVDSGLAFVIVLHLSPEHESTLAEMFQRCTAMPVAAATDGATVEPNSVYVIPPGKFLASADGLLRLTDAHEPRGRRAAVDHFFRTLAESHGAEALAVVLSGAGGDGALGLKRIKELGGLTIAQDPDEAAHADMPRSAIATGVVDWVLAVKEMPAKLLAYVKQRGELRLPQEDGPHPAELVSLSPNEHEAALRDVLTFLHTRTGRDFSCYKRATILRRIARRMQVNGLADLSSYLLYLRTHVGEAGALLQDLLISVTNFFRDPASFSALERTIPQLFAGKNSSDTVRVWVAGCATGEEAYSIAILLSEHAATLMGAPQLQVFATDLDEDVIREAREGLYPESIAADVSEDRLGKFFVPESGGYRVRRAVRELVLFATHDLLKDSPFSRLDLVSCRNLLIYLKREAQNRAFDIFHFALRPSGRLFLGTSETLDDGSPLFAVVDKKHRLYSQRPGPQRLITVPTGPGTFARTLALQERMRERPTLPERVPLENAHTGLARVGPFDSSLPSSELHYRLIERFSPPSVLVNSAHEIVHLSESAGRFLHFTGGEPTRNLLQTVHPMLRVELRAALYAAAETQTEATVASVQLEADGGSLFVEIRVTPAGDLGADFLLVVFDSHPADGGGATTAPRNTESDHAALHLERELVATKAHLRDTMEESKASTEELKASNEELQAINEELRSASEELESSREELQSINEELTTVNDELKTKVDQLARSNSDLENLIGATDIATVFLDRDLRIMRFTPTAKTLFNVISTDLGRPLSDLSRRLDYPDIVTDAERVLAHLQPVEREVSAGERCYVARTVPYRTEDDHISGVVLTFLDITRHRESEYALRASEEQFRALAESIPQLAWMARADGHIFWYNRRWYDYTATTWEQMEGWGWQSVHDPAELPKVVTRWKDSIANGEPLDMVFPIKGGDGVFRPFLTRVEPVKDDRGRVVQWFGTNTDISESKRAEEELKRFADELAAAAHRKDEFLATLAHELRNPLAPIRNGLQVMRLAGATGTIEQARMMMERQLAQLVRLVDDLLDVSRVTSGKLELRRERVALKAVIDAALEASGPALEQGGQELTVVVPDQPIVVDGDLARLTQVVGNLLNNSARYTPRGGHVRITVGREEGTAVVSVADDGIGIPPAMLDKVFQMFVQIDRKSDAATGGLGVGLSLVKGLVQMHGGTIDARSEGEGRGSEFVVRLPVSASTGGITQLPDGEPTEVLASGSRRILVVDDNVDSADSLKQLLELMGNEVRAAHDGEAAVGAAADFRPDVVLMDLGMPKLNGYQAARLIRKQSWGKETLLVAITGWGQEHDRTRSSEAGFDHHLVKPVETAALMKLLAPLDATKTRH